MPLNFAEYGINVTPDELLETISPSEPNLVEMVLAGGTAEPEHSARKVIEAGLGALDIPHDAPVADALFKWAAMHELAGKRP